MLKTTASILASLLAGAACAAPPPVETPAPATSIRITQVATHDDLRRLWAQTHAREAAADGKQAPDDAKLRAQMRQLQAEMDELAKRMGTLAARMGDNAHALAFDYIADPGRGTIGLAMRPTEDGLRVVALSPGAPAQRAGIQVGDVITAIGGVRVDNALKVARNHEKTAGNRADAEAMLAHAEIGKSLAIELLRDGKARDFQVTPERRQPGDWQKILRATEFELDEQKLRQDVERATANARTIMLRAPALNTGSFRLLSAPWWGLNLAPLNPDLGGYFGTARGALVLSSGDNYPGLKAGDVITAVNGQNVERPEDVMRALGKQATDEPARIALRRHGKTVNVEVTPPALDALLPPPPPEPPVPPASPAPPAPPSPPAPSR